MDYCLYNAIKTPDGTILNCEDSHDYKNYKDTVSGEEYMIDGLGYGTRRSINIIPPEDLSVWTSSPFEKVRVTNFWTSYGKDGKSPAKKMCLEEMENSHIEAILRTQKSVKGTVLEDIFVKEIEYRIECLKKNIEENNPAKGVDKKKMKI